MTEDRGEHPNWRHRDDGSFERIGLRGYDCTIYRHDSQWRTDEAKRWSVEITRQYPENPRFVARDDNGQPRGAHDALSAWNFNSASEAMMFADGVIFGLSNAPNYRTPAIPAAR